MYFSRKGRWQRAFPGYCGSPTKTVRLNRSRIEDVSSATRHHRVDLVYFECYSSSAFHYSVLQPRTNICE
eukprot:925268-Pyramimonas_sp.AAC.2